MAIERNQFQSLVTGLNQKKNSSYQSVTKQAEVATQSRKNSTESKVGETVGEVNGGVKSLASNVSGRITEAQLKSDEVTAFKSSTLNVFENITSSMLNTQVLSKIKYSFKADDSDGVGRDSDGQGNLLGSVRVTGIQYEYDSTSTLGEVLTNITGLKNIVKGGFSHAITTNSTPKGLVQSAEKLRGTINSFSSKQELIDLQNSSYTTATIETIDGSPLPNVPGYNFQSQLDEYNNVNAQQDADLLTILEDAELVVDDTLLREDLEQLTGTNGSTVFNAVNSASNDIEKLKTTGDNFVNNFLSQYNGSELGVLQGAVEQSTGKGKSQINDLLRNFSPNEQQRLLRLLQGNNAEKTQAINTIARENNQSVEYVSSRVTGLDTTVSSNIVTNSGLTVFSDPFSIGENNNSWNVNTDQYEYISSVEELDAEFLLNKREITEMVVHWTDTFTNKDIGSEEIHSIQQALGQDGIGYHLVIRRDGSLQRGRPLKLQGNHASINGHNEYSVGLVFVGGYNCPSGTENPENYLSASSLTREQMTTFELVCAAFYKAYPGGQILGHNDLDITQFDPGFDVRDFVLDRFGKESLFQNPKKQNPFTPGQINSARVLE